MEEKKKLKVLVPVDFSRYSLETLRFALSLREGFAASFTLLYVLPMGEVETFASLGGEPAVEQSRKRAEAEAELERLAGDVRRENPEVQISQRVATGVPFKVICRLAEEENFQLIVIGTHGRTGLSHLLVGSTTERVVQLASCPVLSLKPRVL